MTKAMFFRTSRRATAAMGWTLAAAALFLAAGSAEAHAADATPAPASSASVGTTTFGLSPIKVGDNPYRPNFSFIAAPGSTFRDAVSVFNYDNVPRVMRLYATDAFTGVGGNFAVLDAATKAQDIGSWIALDRIGGTTFRVPARTRIDVPFVVKVPAGTSPGDHTGGLVLSLPTASVDTSGNEVSVEPRIAIPISIRLSGDIRAALSIENADLQYEHAWQPWAAGTLRMSFSVRNVGNIALGGESVVTARSLFGIQTREDRTVLGRILPGSFQDISYAWDGMWPLGRYDARAEVAPLAAAGDPTGDVVDTELSVWALPWPQVISLLLVIAIILGARRLSAGSTGGRHVAGPEAKELVDAR